MTLLRIALACLFFPALAARGSDTHVIVLHGLARTSESMVPLAKALEAQGYAVHNVDYPSRTGTVASLSENTIGGALETCRKEGARRIHFVTHSLAGIMVRSYLSRHTIPELGRVVMLSPPNRGSELTDRLRFFRDLFGDVNGAASWELGTSPDSTPNRLGPATFPLGIIASNYSIQFISSLFIPGSDDGRVSVERTKLEGMADHIVVKGAHPFIAKQPETIRQTVAFLEKGRFERPNHEQGLHARR